MGSTARKMINKRQLPPYARAVLDDRRAGGRVGLLVVAVSDWRAGQRWAQRKNVSRIVVPHDFDLSWCDWSFARGLDVLLCIGRGGTLQRLEEVAVSIAQSVPLCTVWVEAGCDGGDSWIPPCAMVKIHPDSPLGQRLARHKEFPAAKLASRVKSRREMMALLGQGPFAGHPEFQQALITQLKQPNREMIDWPAVWAAAVTQQE